MTFSSRPAALLLLSSALVACAGTASLKGGSSAKKSTNVEEKKPANGDADGKDPVTETEDPDEDLRVVPPEVVTGAYLTCTSAVEDTGTVAPNGTVHYGCFAHEEKNLDPIDLKGFVQSWTIFDFYKHAIAATEIAVPEGSRLQKLWEINAADTAKGVRAGLVLDGAEASHAELKDQGAVVIDGKLVSEAGP